MTIQLSTALMLVGIVQVVLLVYVPWIVKLLLKPVEKDICWIKGKLNGSKLPFQ